MSDKLDKIERGLKRSLSTAYNSVSPNRVRHERNIDLLIRAVRQWSNLDVHLMGRARALKEGLLDPDVLNLITPQEGRDA